MKMWQYLIVVCAVLIAIAGCASTRSVAAAPETVVHVDLQRYAGLWYQVARYPHFFQRKECGVSTARYTLRDDGRINVRNDCWADEVDGTSKQNVRAIGRPVDDSNSWLKVRFFGLFNADYLIIDLDPDYGWAVVTTPDRDTLWVLSRTPALEERTYTAIIDRLVDRGFVRQDIIRTSLQ